MRSRVFLTLFFFKSLHRFVRIFRSFFKNHKIFRFLKSIVVLFTNKFSKYYFNYKLISFLNRLTILLLRSLSKSAELKRKLFLIRFIWGFFNFVESYSIIVSDKFETLKYKYFLSSSMSFNSNIFVFFRWYYSLLGGLFKKSGFSYFILNNFGGSDFFFKLFFSVRKYLLWFFLKQRLVANFSSKFLASSSAIFNLEQFNTPFVDLPAKQNLIQKLKDGRSFRKRSIFGKLNGCIASKRGFNKNLAFYNVNLNKLRKFRRGSKIDVTAKRGSFRRWKLKKKLSWVWKRRGFFWFLWRRKYKLNKGNSSLWNVLLALNKILKFDAYDSYLAINERELGADSVDTRFINLLLNSWASKRNLKINFANRVYKLKVLRRRIHKLRFKLLVLKRRLLRGSGRLNLKAGSFSVIKGRISKLRRRLKKMVRLNFRRWRILRKLLSSKKRFSVNFLKQFKILSDNSRFFRRFCYKSRFNIFNDALRKRVISIHLSKIKRYKKFRLGFGERQEHSFYSHFMSRYSNMLWKHHKMVSFKKPIFKSFYLRGFLPSNLARPHFIFNRNDLRKYYRSMIKSNDFVGSNVLFLYCFERILSENYMMYFNIQQQSYLNLRNGAFGFNKLLSCINSDYFSFISSYKKNLDNSLNSFYEQRLIRNASFTKLNFFFFNHFYWYVRFYNRANVRRVYVNNKYVAYKWNFLQFTGKVKRNYAKFFNKCVEIKKTKRFLNLSQLCFGFLLKRKLVELYKTKVSSFFNALKFSSKLTSFSGNNVIAFPSLQLKKNLLSLNRKFVLLGGGSNLTLRFLKNFTFNFKNFNFRFNNSKYFRSRKSSSFLQKYTFARSLKIKRNVMKYLRHNQSYNAFRVSKRHWNFESRLGHKNLKLFIKNKFNRRLLVKKARRLMLLSSSLKKKGFQKKYKSLLKSVFFSKKKRTDWSSTRLSWEEMHARAKAAISYDIEDTHSPVVHIFPMQESEFSDSWSIAGMGTIILRKVRRNFFFTFTDIKGNVIFTANGGRYSVKKRKERFKWEVLEAYLIRFRFLAWAFNLRRMIIKKRVRSAYIVTKLVKNLMWLGFDVFSINPEVKKAHNGCRKRKKRRL